MRGKNESFSVVLLGSWNRSIFSPEWLLKHICSAGTEKVFLAYPSDDPTGAIKIDFEDISLYPGPRQLMVVSKNPTKEGIKKCEDVVAKIIGLLVHTPVTFCGINFSFVETENTVSIFKVLSASDKSDIAQKGGYSIVSSGLVRRLQRNDKLTLNLTLTDADGVATIAFNFHYELNDIYKYKELFSKDEAANRLDDAIKFCKEVYELNLEEDVT